MIKRVIARHRLSSIGVILLVFFLIFGLIPVLAIGIFAYESSVHSIRDQTRENVLGTLEQIRNNIVDKTDEAKNISDLLFGNTQMQKALRSYEQGWYSYDTTVNIILPTLENLLQNIRYPLTLKLYLDNASIPEIYNYPQRVSVDPVSTYNRYDVLHMERITTQPWYRNLPWKTENGTNSQGYRGNEYEWEQIEGDRQFDEISLLRPLTDFNNQNQYGFVRAIVKLESILDSVDNVRIGEGSRIYVFDEDGQTLFSSGGTEESKEIMINQTADDYLMIEENLHETGWSVVALVPNALLEKGANRVQKITITICLLAGILLVIAGWFISSYYAKRARRIIRSIDHFRSGEFRKVRFMKGRDEFAQIAHAFNEMGEEIDMLIHEVYLANTLKKEAELETLMTQINPHFLYNTLSSIGKLATIGEIDQLQRMVRGLAKFYRLTLNNGENVIGVVQELEQVMAYIEIQQIKYRDHLIIYDDIDCNIYGYETVKLILQPFVENVLEHAIVSRGIEISISARKHGDTIVFRIVDSGIGMKEQTIASIFAASDVRIGYGIRNVDERIKLQYGKQFGVRIASRIGIGTSVTIVIPAIARRSTNLMKSNEGEMRSG
ncbi:cache domain-containing sensor histidine kinase [Paenibacillus sp. strain BS8-2]